MPHPRFSGRATRLVSLTSWWLLSLLVAGIVVGPTANAHPFGDPQRIEVAEEGDRGVRVHWKVGGTDDLTVLGIALGVLPEDRVMLDGAVTYEDDDGALLAASTQFADYLTERISVRQPGAACTPVVEVAPDLAEDGAVLRFTCPAPADAVTVTSRMLTDLHPAYRTLAIGPGGQKAVYDAKNDSVRWTLDGAAPVDAPVDVPTAAIAPVSAGSSAAVQFTSVASGFLAVALAGAFWYRRRERKA